MRTIINSLKPRQTGTGLFYHPPDPGTRRCYDEIPLSFVPIRSQEDNNHQKRGLYVGSF
jgi:hypothetical protein